jgi:hypothetical protein
MHDIHHKFIVFTRDSRENQRLSRQASPFPPNPLLFWRALLDKLNEWKVHLISEENEGKTTFQFLQKLNLNYIKNTVILNLYAP